MSPWPLLLAAAFGSHRPALSARLSASCAHLPDAPPRAARANDNRATAGTLTSGVLTIRLVAQRAAWRPDGPTGCALGVHAFAEEGKPVTVPGPLIRVVAGTEVRVSVRNALSEAMWVRGLQDRAAGSKLDSTEVLPGATHEFRFVATTRGAWHYWAGAAGARSPRSDVNGQLVGALVVDSTSAEARRADRILVLTRWSLTGSADNKGFQLNAINGRSWPNTERLTYPANDSVRWHVINASNSTHEMHLHGFFFRIDRRGFTIDSAGGPFARLDPNVRRSASMRVTSVMRPSEWIQIAWLPDRAGNWLFHCHLLTHMKGEQRLDRMRETSAAAAQRDHGTDASGKHADHDMGGLVMALDIRPARNAGTNSAATRPERALDLYANTRPGKFGAKPGYGFVLKEGPTPPAPDSILIPGSPLVLTKGQPARITVHNRLTVPISVHWHGLELESFFDGVGGFSGAGRRIAPMITPKDSFVVRLTPPRAGTYMYHIHGERGEELAAGLYGHLVVVDSATPFDPERERLFAFADGGPGGDNPIFVNGSPTPDTVELSVGTPYRFRMIYISSDDVYMTTLRGPDGSLPLARSFGIDAWETPALPPRPVQYPTGPGHTRDVAITFDAPGTYTLTAQRTTGGATTTVPLKVMAR